MKILATEDPTRPAFTRWIAVDDDTYDGALDGNHPLGQGRTKAEAIADLKEQIADREEERGTR